MQEREETFFSKHYKLIFGLAFVVIFLNIALYFLVPQQKTVQVSGVVTEYSLTDSSFAREHEVEIDGFFMNSIALEDTFTGTFVIEGLRGTEREDKAELLQDGHTWKVVSQSENTQSDGPEAAVVRYDKENDVWLIALRDPDHFLVIGVPTRQAACWRYAEAFGLAYQPEA